MSAAWDASTIAPCDAKASKKFIRLWCYLAVAGGFLFYVYSQLHLSLF